MKHSHHWTYPKDPRPGMEKIHGLYRVCKCGKVQTMQAVYGTCGMQKFQNEQPSSRSDK
jgi:hypothetical protein